MLSGVADLGLQVVLTSSAPEDELEMLRKVVDCEHVVSVATSSHDVDTAKPEPGILQVAQDRAGVTADRAVFVGDTVWDARAALGAGLSCFGLLSGGISGAELQKAGASPIFADPRDLLANLDFTRIAELVPSR